MATCDHLVQILEAAGERYQRMSLGGDMEILISERGARVLGLFPATGAENLFWTPGIFDSSEAFAAFTGGSDWNMGGERIWIAPEIVYIVGDRDDFFATHQVPPAMDPGEFILSADDGTVMLSMDSMTLTSRVSGASRRMKMRRTLQLAPNPLSSLRDVDAIMQEVRYGGYVTLAHQEAIDGDSTLPSEHWIVAQVNAGGRIIIPCTPEPEISEYFSPIPPEIHAVQTGDGVPYTAVEITGRQQFKIGIKSASTTGRLAYHFPMTNGEEALIVRGFHNDPSNFYPEDPPAAPGDFGASIFVYNDGGQFGGSASFGEMECVGQTLGGTSTATQATDAFHLWTYVGTPEAIARVAFALLGVAL